MMFAPNRYILRLALPALLLVTFGAGPAAALGEFDRAARLAMVGDYQGALGEYEQFLYDHPDHDLAPLAVLAAGNLQMEAFENPEAAVRKFNLIITDYPSSPLVPEAASRKGTAFHALENWRAAADAFETALELAGRPGNTRSASWLNTVTSTAADCYHRLDDREGVLNTYRRALEGSPPAAVTATALWRMGEAYEAMGDAPNAATSYAGVLERAPCASRQIFAQAMGKREMIEAHVDFEWEPYEVYLGTIGFIEQRDFAGALDECRRAEAMNPNPALRECLEARAISLESIVTADFAEACQKMEALRERYPGGQQDERTANLIAFWTSVVDAETEVARDPDNPQALSGLGVLYYYTGAYDSAIETLARAQKLDPELTATYQILGLSYYNRNRLEDAVQQFDLLLEKDHPDDPSVFATAGTACMRLERFDKAVLYFERQAEVSEDDPSAHSNLADALYRAERPADALEACNRAIELDPDNSSAHYFVGRIRQDQNERRAALEAYERFLELAPGNELAEQVRAAVAELRGG